MSGNPWSIDLIYERPIDWLIVQVGVNLNQQWDGSWVVTKCYLEHSGHPVSKQDYFSNAHVKKLNPDDFEYVKMLAKTNAKTRIIADLVSQKTGKEYGREELRYLIKKVDDAEKESLPAVEKVLEEIREAGGSVMLDKDPLTKNVDVLWLCLLYTSPSPRD